MKFLLIIPALILGACSSIVKGDTQNMSVTTPNCPGAECRLHNNQGTYFVANTPSTININKSASAMSIDCKKGDAQEIITVESGTEGMAFGNILAGGIIGAAVDMNTGAAYKYPALVEHPLSCS